MRPACGLSDVMSFPPVRESLTPDYRSVDHLRFSLRGILSLDIVCRSGFGWDCSLARCLLLLSWMTSWTVGMPRSEWILSLNRDCRSGFGWDCSLARCLLLLSWMTSWMVDWCNKYCIAVFEIESSWWSGFRLQVERRSCFVVGRVELRPRNVSVVFSCFVAISSLVLELLKKCRVR